MQAEWRANKEANQAAGKTEKAYVAECRAAAGAIPPAAPASAPAPAPAPTVTAPARPIPSRPARTATVPFAAAVRAEPNRTLSSQNADDVLLDLRKLEAAEVVAGRSVEGAADKSGKNLDMPDIVALRLVAEGPDGHVRDHAAAKIADRLIAHWRAPVLRLEFGTPQSSGRDARPAIAC